MLQIKNHQLSLMVFVSVAKTGISYALLSIMPVLIINTLQFQNIKEITCFDTFLTQVST